MPILPRVPGLAYGGDYNPEQWPESVWQEDARLMQAAGVNLVSVAIFAWAKLNPAPGQWDFAWLDKLLDLLHGHGVYACLATATASPPAWFLQANPDVCPVKADGTRLIWGSRQCYTPSAPAYLAAVKEMAQRLGERYAKHPGLAAWHVNNEYGCHVPMSYGPHDAAAFRVWLRKKYGTLDALNHAWGTAFWSQTYTDWEQVMPPLQTPAQPNPSGFIDFRRFSSDALLNAFRVEAEELRKCTPDIPVVTNFMGHSHSIDQFSWADDVDFAALDAYPEHAPRNLGSDWGTVDGRCITRGLKRDRPWVLMEQVTSQVNWRNLNHLKRPGVMRLQSMQAVAHGADGVMFFQWRAAKAGSERFHGAMLPHVDPEKSRVVREVRELGADLKKIAEVRDTLVKPDAAMLFSWDNLWEFTQRDHPRQFDYIAEVVDPVFQAMIRSGLVTDIVSYSADLSRYQFVVLPLGHMLSKAEADNLRSYVQGGGTLLVTFFSGVADELNHIQLGGYPAHLRDVLGICVEEWEPVEDGRPNRMRFADGSTIIAGLFNEVLHLEGAEALATFTHDFYEGSPALTRHTFGSGTAYYLAGMPAQAELKNLLGGLARDHGWKPVVEAPENVEAVVREGESGRFLFLLNHSEREVQVPLESLSGVDLLTGNSVEGVATLAKRGVAVIRLKA